MAMAAAYRQIRPTRRYTASRANRRSAVNTGFHGYFPCDLHRIVRIKDDVKIDQACGTGGMLSTAYSYIRHFNPTADVRLFGQGYMGQTYAIGLDEMLIKDQSADNFFHTDTLKEDCFSDTKMRFLIENPPFGTLWSGADAKDSQELAVKREFEKGSAGRWGAGLPAGGDSQLLFMPVCCV